MNSPTVVIGIDPGLVCPGLALILGGDLSLTCSYKPNRKLALADRLRVISDCFAKEILTHKPDAVAIEEQRFVQVGKRARGQMGEHNSKTLIVVGIAVALASVVGAEVLFIPPQKAKIAALGKGYGNASKGAVQVALRSLFRKVQFEDEAQADAAAIAIAGYRMMGLPKELRQKARR